MAIAVKFWLAFAKRDNSTKQPDDQTAVSVSCLLKEVTSKEAPVFILSDNRQSGFNPELFRYCQAWGNYYYINSREYVPPHWYLHCTMDVLATYKAAIGGSFQYVLRAADPDVWNSRLFDQLPAEAGPTTEIANFAGSLFPYPTSTTGVYVVTIAGNTSSDTGGGAYRWVMTPAEYGSFMRVFMDNFQWSASDAAASQMKAWVKPQDWIQDVRWYPVDKSAGMIANAQQPVYCGSWDTGATGDVMTEGYVYQVIKTMTIPKHPQAATWGKFLNTSTYSVYTFVDPSFGVITVDPNSIADCTVLTYRLDIDMTCGLGHLRITGDGDGQQVTVAERSCEFGVPSFMTFQSRDFVGAIANTSLSQPFSSAVDLVKTLAFPKTDVAGSAGSRAMFQYQPLLYCEFTRVKPIAPSVQGYPVCQGLTLGSLSGYIKCSTGDVEITGTPEARSAIKSYLEGGFYYE